MRLSRRFLTPALLVLALASSARADDVNPLTQNRLWATPPAASGNPTAGQFGGFSPVSSSASTSTAGGNTVPTSGGQVLRVSMLGASFAGAVPEFFIGDIVGTPLYSFTDNLNRPASLARQPVRATDAAFKYQLPGSTVVHDFDPAVLVIGERFLWSPDAQFYVTPDNTATYEQVVPSGTAGAVSHDGFVYATQGGSSHIYWKTSAPIAVDASNNPVFGLIDRLITVSSSSKLPVRRIFWTEQGFQGLTVTIPKGDIQQVRVAYTDAFPELVPAGQEYQPPGNSNNGSGTATVLPRGTLWYDNTQSALHAYNREGRVLVEFLGEVRSTTTGVRRQVGIEVVDVIQEAAPVAVDVPLGERVYPLSTDEIGQQNYPLPDDATGKAAAQARIASNLAAFSPSLVINLAAAADPFVAQFQVANQIAYYAQKVTVSASDVQIFWNESGLDGIQWPKFLDRYHLYWPDSLADYAVNVRPTDLTQVGGTLPIFGQQSTFQLVYQDDPTQTQATVVQGTGFQVTLNGSTPVNHSLLLFQSGDDFWYVRVESVLDTQLADPRYAQYYAQNVTANVGDRLTPPAGADSIAGYVDLTRGTALDPTAYVNPFTAGITAAEKGAIIPVNAAPTKYDTVSRTLLANGNLGVWWFKKISPPAALAGKIAPLYWPSFFYTYKLAWPQNARQIVLASNLGSDDLNADAASGTIYYQNDPSQIGYNPNEEHAQMIAGRAYALRDDLNNPAVTSDRYVLVRYFSAADSRPAIQAFQVVRENAQYKFTYDAKAGTVLQAPMPLAIMPPPLLPDNTSKNLEVTPVITDPPVSAPASLGTQDYYNRFTYEDRKGLKWIYRGQHNPTATPPALGMKFYYATMPGFAYPDPATGLDTAPVPGTLTPFLRPLNGSGGYVGDAVTGDSIVVSFKPWWPDLVPDGLNIQSSEVPVLHFAETLIKPHDGLPGLQGATSATILYQQSIGQNFTVGQKSAVMHDATRRKVYYLGSGSLTSLPSSIATSSNNGLTYFQNLPAHLQQRFFVDPNIGTTTPTLGGLVLQGQFIDEVVGDSYLLPNILSADDLAALKGLVSPSDPSMPAWNSAIDSLSTTLQTFIENPARPGTYIPDTTQDKPFTQASLVEITNDNQAVDSYALTAVGGGAGYVTVILGNGKAFTDSSEPVQVEILKVGDSLYRGQVKPITPANPLSEQITMQHTGDFAGHVQDYEFQWRYSPPVDGQPPVNTPDQPGTSWFSLTDQLPRITLGGNQPLITLTDNYFVMRYRPKEGHALRPTGSNWTPSQGWSQWTPAALAEGWIKRVLAGINPFDQRLSDFYNNTVNTDVSLLTQAGTRWEGDVPLTLGSVQDAGLISIYETLLRRAISFTIDGSPAVNYPPANDALLLAAGYLNDLYMALGNEAYADASNPTISLDVDPSRLLTSQGLPASIGTTIQQTATARFSFEGQVPDLLSEQLVLLRGRDDTLSPGTQTAPVYNRFYWNFTRGINAGEVIYALNYNITEKAGPTADGKIDATDAAYMFPQGHGDAYGHYLTALTNYYRLLSNPNFTWTPRVESVDLLGVPVTVDYQDERKLAAAAVAAGRTVSQVIDLERRKLPVGTDTGWSGLRESVTNATTGVTRSWGVEQWASRGGQGNFVHWAVINSLLPENDFFHQGLQKIDRHSVPELDEIATLGTEIQGTMDAANRRINALNLSDDSVLFDLSPADLAAGNSHFDQILARAKAALANAATAHARTVEQNALLRTVANQAADYNFTVSQQETAFENRLIDVYGQPYAGDIGPGKTYDQGYGGADYLRFMYIDRPYVYNTTQLFGASPLTTTFTLPVKSSSYNIMLNGFDGSTASADALYANILTASKDPTQNITYTFDLNAGPYQVATADMGKRASTGQVQQALLAVMNAREQLYTKLVALSNSRTAFANTIHILDEDTNAKVAQRGLNDAYNASKLVVTKALGANDLINTVTGNVEKTLDEITASVITGFPRVNGIDNDLTSAARAAILATKVTSNKVLSAKQITTQISTYLLNLGLDLDGLAKDEANATLQVEIDSRAKANDLKTAYSAVFSGISDVDASVKNLAAALDNYQNALTDGLTIQAERDTFRKRAAAVIQGSRIRDVAFRAFRTETLEQYKILFDQAARYSFLAAKAYDYETALLGTSTGQSFLSRFVATRSLGLVGPNGEPQIVSTGSGDGGLSSLLAQMQADWGVVKGRLGINNPDTYGTLFSLRRELFNIPYVEDGVSTTGDQVWQDRLRSLIVTDLRADATVAAHALPTSNPSGLAQPGFIITFPTTIQTGQNFFGNPLAAGDSAYSTASYSTKIKAVGVVFQGYLGMNTYTNGGTGIPSAPSLNSPNALAATPYVYLLPAGSDSMRTPPLNGLDITTRSWLVLDQAMPLPYDIGASGTGQDTLWTSSTSLSEPFFTPRKHQPFRATDTAGIFFQPLISDFTNSRLIGRSVWNAEWKMVIPAQTLLANPQDGMERFLRSVKDIKLFIKSYSYSGN